jgi:FtsP/CotA-like multicopper oxidase with cupredoxin domain
MGLTRRELFKALGVTGLGAAGIASGCSPIFESRGLTKFIDPLPLFPVARAGAPLPMAPGRHRFHSELPLADTWGYGGASFGGPRLQAVAGERVVTQVANSLGAHPLARDVDPTVPGAVFCDVTKPRTSVHLHGGLNPAPSDGHPKDTFITGQSREYIWPSRQEAASLWYHDHAMGITRLNVHAGLFGMYDLRDNFDTGDSSNPLGLPSGEFEIPLAIADRAFDNNGHVRFRSFTFVPEGKWEGGFIGDVATVNGAVWPQLSVGRGVYRFRMLNASNLTTYHLSFSNRMAFWVIGNDQGLLNEPVRTASFRMSPGERIDVLVDFSGLSIGDRVVLTNDHPLPVQASIFGSRVVNDIMAFDVAGGATSHRSIPTVLRGSTTGPARLPSVDSLLRRVSSTRNVTISQLWANRNPPAWMTLDNVGIDVPATPARQGTVEQWNFINTTGDDHPMHIHLAKFQVLGRTRFDASAYQLLQTRPAIGREWNPTAEPFATRAMQAPDVWERGWKDTVLAPGFTITRVLVQWPTVEECGFDPDERYRVNDIDVQGYVFHCHVIDHEDNEMMREIRAVNPSAA